MDPAASPEQLAARLTHLEMLFTHLERQAAELSQTILAQERRLDQMQKQLERLVTAGEDEETGFEEEP